MKFQKKTAIEPTPATVPDVAPEPPPQAVIDNVPQIWLCIACEAVATVLHRGTGYCRKHYTERNYNATLVN